MRLHGGLLALAAYATSAQGFKDTSPFLMFSNSPSPQSLRESSHEQLQSKYAVLDSAKSFLKLCPSELYYIISLPSIRSLDLSSSAPRLKNAIQNPAVHTRYSVSEVVGLKGNDADELVKYLQEECGTEKNDVVSAHQLMKMGHKEGGMVVQVNIAEVDSAAEREQGFSDIDADLYQRVLKNLPDGSKYTVIYMTTPPILSFASLEKEKAIVYHSEFEEPLHMDLRRQLQERKNHNISDSYDGRGLFEKYSFFSEGIFVGILVGAILLSILGVGMSALGSLQVSYGSFDKEMGPAAQRKQ